MDRPRRHLGLRVLSGVLLMVVAYVGVTGIQVWWASRQDGARDAEAIVVLGAAQYDGRPSPVLEARLDHVVELYEQGYADYIIVTGGNQPGDRFTEAETSARYLSLHGVPGGLIERETTGATSYESLASVARFLREDGVRDVILVSDPYHSQRIASIAEEVGLAATVSPTPTSPFRGWERLHRIARETLAVAVGRIVGFRRLDRLTSSDAFTTIVP